MTELDKKIKDLKDFIKQKTDQGTANYLGKEIREICGMVETEQLTIHSVVKSLKGKEVIPFEDWREENCKHLAGDLYSFKQNVFDSYDLRYVYMRECKQSI